MQNRHRQIIYQTPKGNDIMETCAGEFYVLDGWDDDVYLLCYRSNYFGVRLDKEYHVIKPIYGEIKLFDYDGKEYPIYYEIIK